MRHADSRASHAQRLVLHTLTLAQRAGTPPLPLDTFAAHPATWAPRPSTSAPLPARQPRAKRQRSSTLTQRYSAPTRRPAHLTRPHRGPRDGRCRQTHARCNPAPRRRRPARPPRCARQWARHPHTSSLRVAPPPHRPAGPARQPAGPAPQHVAPATQPTCSAIHHPGMPADNRP